ncbi:hypothetical protein IAT38_003786 [Cryptococcus sp. DSM 104549]
MAEDIHPQSTDSEEDACRVCRGVEDEEYGKFVHPCKCSGSVKFVHESCLKQWVANAEKKQCEICGHKYTFAKVYPESLPDRIPITVYLRQGSYWIGRQVQLFFRAWLAVIAWLVILPGVSMCALRAMVYFTDSIGLEGPEVLEAMAANGTDIDYGSEQKGGITVTGVWLVDMFIGPLPAIYRLTRRSIRSWMQGDPDTAVGFVLRGQILALSLAAVIVGLILLREWVTQHNWNEEANQPRPLEDAIVPDDWMIVDGRAIRFSERIASLVEETRAFVPPAASGGNGALATDPEGAALMALFLQRGPDFSHEEWMLFVETAQYLAAQGNPIAKLIVNEARRIGAYPYNPPQEDEYPSQAAFNDARAAFEKAYVEKMKKLRTAFLAGLAKVRRDLAQKEQEQAETARQAEVARQAEAARQADGGEVNADVAAGVADEGEAEVEAPAMPPAQVATVLEAAFIAALDGDVLDNTDPYLRDNLIPDDPVDTPANPPVDAAPTMDADSNPRHHQMSQTLPGRGPDEQDEDELRAQQLWTDLANRAENNPDDAVGPFPHQELVNGSPFPHGLFTEQPNLVYERRQRGEDDAQEQAEHIEADMRELLPPWEREELEREDARRREASAGIMGELTQYRAMHAKREQAGVDANGAGPSNSGGAAQPERPGRNGYGSPPGDMAYVAPELLGDVGASGYRGAPGDGGAGSALGEGTGEGGANGQAGEDDYEIPEARRTLPLYPEAPGLGPEREDDPREVHTDPGLPHGPHVQDYPMPPNFMRFQDDQWEDEADDDGEGGDDDAQLLIEEEGEDGEHIVHFQPNQEVLQRLQADGRLVAVDFVEEGGELLDDDEGWDPDDVQGMLDVVGLTGPISGLLQNVLFGCMIMVLASAILIGIPMAIGKIFLSVDLIRTALMMGLRTLRLVKKITVPVVDVVWEITKDVLLLPAIGSFKALERIVLKKLGMSAWEVNRFGGFAAVNKASSSGFTVPAPIVALLARVPPSLRPDELLAALGQRSLDEYDKYIARNRAWATSGTMGGRAGCVLAGYASMLGTVLLIALGGEAGFGNAAGMLAGVIKQNVTFIKVAFFMILELAVFPLGVGFIIDFCTVPAFPNATILGRLEQLAAAPFGTVFVNWLQGTMFMFFFANILSDIRQMCRPGTMFFIRDPADPNFSPVKDIMEKSTLHQMRKLGTSAVMYSVVIFMLFGAASWGLAYQPFWDILPLRMEPAFGPLTSVPFDYLFLHLIVPPTFDMVRPRHRARKHLSSLWRFTVEKFRLATLMEPDVDPDKVLEPAGKAEVAFWKSADVVCQILFGKYDPRSSDMRVPANDSVVLLPLPQRRIEGGVFVPLTADGRPRTAADKLRLLKQDKVAREAGRNPEADYTVVRVPQWWRTRINVLITCFLLVASGVVAGGVMGPVLVGRLLWTFFDVKVHDGYAWFAGVYVLYGSLYLGRRARKYISTMDRASRLRSSVASRRAKRAALKFTAGVYGVGMVYGVLPVLTGIVFEIALGIFRTEVPAEHVRVIHVWDVWANGLAMWSLAVGLGSVLHRAHLHWIDPIRICFREPAAHGFRVTTNATWGPIRILAGLIAAPHIFYILLALISKESNLDESTDSKLFHQTIPLILFIFISNFPDPIFASQFAAIRQKMVDAEYVVEERVENYVPTPEKKGKPGSNASGPGSHWVGPAHHPPNGNEHAHAPAPVGGGGALGGGLADGDDDIVQAWREYRAGVIQDELLQAMDEVDGDDVDDGGEWEDM